MSILKENTIKRTYCYRDDITRFREAAYEAAAVKDELEGVAEPTNKDTILPQSIGNNRLLFTATVVHYSGDEPQYVAARAILDSGSDISLISRRYVEETGLTKQLQPLKDPLTFKGIEGSVFTSSAQIDLTWYIKSSSSSRRTSFLLTEDESFDILLGNQFISGNHIFGREPRVLMTIFKYAGKEGESRCIYHYGRH